MQKAVSDMNQYIVLYFAFLIYSASSVCAKMAALQIVPEKMILFLCLEIGCLAVYAFIWQQVLKKFTLVTAMASKGSVIIFNLIWSVCLFHETITVYNVAGAVIVIGGICIVSLDL